MSLRTANEAVMQVTFEILLPMSFHVTELHLIVDGMKKSGDRCFGFVDLFVFESGDGPLISNVVLELKYITITGLLSGAQGFWIKNPDTKIMNLLDKDLENENEEHLLQWMVKSFTDSGILYSRIIVEKGSSKLRGYLIMSIGTCRMLVRSYEPYVEKNFSPHLIATGHYTEVVFNNEQYYLSKPKDKEKDQTYFLCQVNPMLFKKIIFLLANLTKQEVRQLALHLQLVNAKKKDSTGICFIGKRKFDKFLANYLTKSVGKIIDVDKKKIIGQHQGTPYYTIGQWRNLGLAGHCTPYYLVGKNDKKNLLYVSQGRNNK
ncbi:22347_t:CDS:2 [Entrophospora sp. SA101]|nr:22347_t:CDS:2 [Entrophospora sp. SA101]